MSYLQVHISTYAYRTLDLQHVAWVTVWDRDFPNRKGAFRKARFSDPHRELKKSTALLIYGFRCVFQCFYLVLRLICHVLQDLWKNVR